MQNLVCPPRFALLRVRLAEVRSVELRGVEGRPAEVRIEIGVLVTPGVPGICVKVGALPGPVAGVVGI